MVDNQHKKISGYRDLTQDEIDAMNAIKSAEAELASLWQRISAANPGADRRWLAVARTHFQEGFSAFVRSIAQPEDPFAVPAQPKE
jgi:hypothetical protein